MGLLCIWQRADDGKGWKLSQTLPAPGGSNNTDFGRKVRHSEHLQYVKICRQVFSHVLFVNEDTQGTSLLIFYWVARESARWAQPSLPSNAGACMQVVVSSTGKVLVVSDPLAVSGPQSCGIFGAMPGYVTSGQVYTYVLQGDSQTYKLAQTLQGNTSLATGFGADIGAAVQPFSHELRPPCLGSSGARVCSSLHIVSSATGLILL